MAERNAWADPDHRAGSLDDGRGVAGISCRVYTSHLGTWFEVWQTGPDLPVGGVRVSAKRFPRHTQDNPDPLILAGFLARMVSSVDREGWEQLR